MPRWTWASPANQSGGSGLLTDCAWKMLGASKLSPRIEGRSNCIPPLIPMLSNWVFIVIIAARPRKLRLSVNLARSVPSGFDMSSSFLANMDRPARHRDALMANANAMSSSRRHHPGCSAELAGRGIRVAAIAPTREFGRGVCGLGRGGGRGPWQSPAEDQNLLMRYNLILRVPDF